MLKVTKAIFVERDGRKVEFSKGEIVLVVTDGTDFNKEIAGEITDIDTGFIEIFDEMIPWEYVEIVEHM